MYKLKVMIFIVITDDDENSFVTEAIFSLRRGDLIGRSCPSVCLSVGLSVGLSVCLSVGLSVCRSVYRSVCLSVGLSSFF